jgi:hypothetical protein
MAEVVSIKDVYRELLEIKHKMISREELASLLETWEILHNPETMRQLRASEQNIRAGRTKPVRNVKELLAEFDK